MKIREGGAVFRMKFFLQTKSFLMQTQNSYVQIVLYILITLEQIYIFKATVTVELYQIFFKLKLSKANGA